MHQYLIEACFGEDGAAPFIFEHEKTYTAAELQAILLEVFQGLPRQDEPMMDDQYDSLIKGMRARGFVYRDEAPKLRFHYYIYDSPKGVSEKIRARQYCVSEMSHAAAAEG